MQYTIQRRPGYEYLPPVTVEIDDSTAAGASPSRLLGLALIAAISLGTANLTRANLDGANLTRANLTRANLDGANLTRANLYGANLYGANLDGANLTRANLDGANLYGANLTRANLYGANLTRANLDGANLTRANLYGANLTRANLDGANLTRANLDGANLYGANLTRANLDGANLTRANLDGAARLHLAHNVETVRFRGFQIPQTGTLTVFKKLRDGNVATLLIPAKAARTATPIGRKCRAAFAKVLKIEDASGNAVASGWSSHDAKFFYAVGAVVKCKQDFEPSPFVECASGIHFFLTREEAEAY